MYLCACVWAYINVCVCMCVCAHVRMRRRMYGVYVMSPKTFRLYVHVSYFKSLGYMIFIFTRKFLISSMNFYPFLCTLTNNSGSGALPLNSAGDLASKPSTKRTFHKISR